MEKSKDFEAILASNADIIPHGVALGADPSKDCPDNSNGASNCENPLIENLENAKLALEKSKQKDKASNGGLTPWQKQLVLIIKELEEKLLKEETKGASKREEPQNFGWVEDKNDEEVGNKGASKSGDPLIHIVFLGKERGKKVMVSPKFDYDTKLMLRIMRTRQKILSEVSFFTISKFLKFWLIRHR